MCSDTPYAIRMIGLSLLSAALAIAVSCLQRARQIPFGLRPAVARLPSLPLIGRFVGIRKRLARLDELQRMIRLEAMMVQFAVVRRKYL